MCGRAWIGYFAEISSFATLTPEGRERAAKRVWLGTPCMGDALEARAGVDVVLSSRVCYSQPWVERQGVTADQLNCAVRIRVQGVD